MKRMMKRLFLIAMALFFWEGLYAQHFGTCFAEQTLRLDYTFAGNADQQFIALKALKRSNGWTGRRVNLASVPLRGNGDITMRNAASGEVIYRTSFSSLFQEWLVTPEARELSRSFEASFLLPMPRSEAVVEISLRNNRGEEQCRLQHRICPDDPLMVDLTGRPAVDHEYVWQGGASERCIDVVILAEGYALEEMDSFMEDARTAAEEILRYAPFASYRDRFNFIAVKSPSEESGVTLPQEGIWRNTAVGSNFMTFYMPRYLTTGQVHRLYDWVTNIPCEHLIVLANTDTYGGGGIYNSYTLTTAHHPHFKPVVVHEFGHSFGGLGDEYFYDSPDMVDETHALDREPWEPNITTLVDFSSKWADLLPDPHSQIPTEPTESRKETYEVGLYEGGGYRTKGIFRPAVVCRMRDNTATRFCPVCERALERVILHQTEPLQK